MTLTGLFPKIRFLPVIIFAAALMLTVKIGDIWQGFGGILGGTITVAEARAQQATPAAPAQQNDPAAGPGAAADAGAAAATPARALGQDPTLLTQAEIDLLQQLAERREALESRDQEMDMRAGLLDAAEVRISRKVDELNMLQETIKGLIKTYDGQQDEKMKSLVKIYENMKPKDAARIFEELDMDTLLLVAERMKERKLAPVMAKMDPRKAKDMTVELAQRRQLPKKTEGRGG